MAKKATLDYQKKYHVKTAAGEELYDKIERICCGSEAARYLAKRDGKVGILDAKGGAVIPLEYSDSDIQIFYNFVAVTNSGHQMGLINYSGEIVMPFSQYLIDHHDLRMIDGKEDLHGVLKVETETGDGLISGLVTYPEMKPIIFFTGDDKINYISRKKIGFRVDYSDHRYGFINFAGNTIVSHSRNAVEFGYMYEYVRDDPTDEGVVKIIDVKGEVFYWTICVRITRFSRYENIFLLQLGRTTFSDDWQLVIITETQKIVKDFTYSETVNMCRVEESVRINCRSIIKQYGIRQ